MYKSFALRQAGADMASQEDDVSHEDNPQTDPEQGVPSVLNHSSDQLIDELRKSSVISAHPVLSKLSFHHSPELSAHPLPKPLDSPTKKSHCRFVFVTVLTLFLLASTTIGILLLEEPMQRLLNSMAAPSKQLNEEERAAEINSTLPPASTVDFTHQKTWGTYRPHLYFGLKAKHVQSPLFGLMWYKQPNNDVGTKKSNIQLRHWCKHEDPVVFLWHDHDGRSFGIQNIEDGGLKFSTQWFNTPSNSCLANVALDTDAQTGNSTYGFIFYFAIPSNGSRGDMIPKYRLDGNNLKVLDFLSPDFGQLSLQLAVKDNTGNGSITTNPRFSYLYSKQEPLVDMTGLDKLVSEALHTTSPDNMLELQDTGLATESPNFAAVHLVVDASAMEHILDNIRGSRRSNGIDYKEVVKFNGSEAEDNLEEWQKRSTSSLDEAEVGSKGKKRSEKHSIENFVCVYSQRKLYKCPAVLRIRRPSTTFEIIVEKAKDHSNHQATVEQPLSSPVESFIRSKMRDKTAKRIQNDMLFDRINFPVEPMLRQLENFITREKKDDNVILTTEDLRNYFVEHADVPENGDNFFAAG